MKLHVSLRATTNIALLVVWLLITLAVFLASQGVALVFVAPAAVLGAVGGAMQSAAMRGSRDAFRTAQTAMDVRRALRSHVWGARYLIFFWVVQVLFFVVAIAIGKGAPASSGLGPFWTGIALVSLYAAFALGRDAMTLRALDELSADR